MPKILIAMSGGVDSSVAAYLVTKQGYSSAGATMKLFDNEDIGLSGDSPCCSDADIADAKKVAESLGMEHYVFNLSDSFKERVIEKFIADYENGATPNPCVECNRYIKFDGLMQCASKLNFDAVATGHYARIEKDGSGRFLLKKAVDLSKDQSYVLYSLTQEQLSRTVFPLGGLSKAEVREIAAEQHFINANKHDSQDICFVKDGDYVDFVEQYLNKRYEHGLFIDLNGNTLGEHKGIIRYTIGQRKGLGLALPCPMYVVSKSIEDNTVTLGYNEDLFSRSLDATNVNLIVCERIDSAIRVKAKVRYKHAEQWATVEQTGENSIHIEFDEPQRAITKGQAVVLYDDDIVVGGGTII